MFQKFCGYTTVQGLVYIFVQNLSPIGKVYWISAFIMLISLGSFWAAKMYSDWQNVQVYQLRSNIFFFYFLLNFYYSESICKKSWLKYLTIKSYNYWNFDLGDDNNFLNWCFCQWNGVSFSHFLQSRKYWHNLRSSFDWKVQWVLEKQLRN